MLGGNNNFIDNKNVVERAKKAQESYNTSYYQVPDHDLWLLTTELKRALPIRVKFDWIKSHQDTNEHGDEIYGPFKRNTQLNIWTNKLASEGMKRSEYTKVQRPAFSTSLAVLKNKEGIAIQNLRGYLLRSKNGEELTDYYREKRDGIQGLKALSTGKHCTCCYKNCLQ